MKYSRITKKEIIHYKGKVYDLEVRDVHSYNIDGLIVHNSGAGSLLNYVLDITQIDPMQYDLIFERFLNPARKYVDDKGKTHLTIPDIDNDFSDKRSDEIYDFCNQRWGQNHCCNILTFQNLKMKAVFKDVSRVYEIDSQTANSITKLMPEEAKTFDDTLAVPEIKEFFLKYPDIKKYCEIFSNLPRTTSQHPAGIVILPNELDVTDIIPVKSAKTTDTGNTYNCAQYCKEEVDLLGGVKYDILRLSNIDILVEELNMINRYYNKNYTQMSIPIDDKKTWDFICEAVYLKGIFQMDGASAQPVIKKIQPHDMEELSAVNAFIRPGTSGLDEYVEGKKDPSKIRLMGYKPFDDVLAPTMGGIVYQEQVMSLISILFNISFGESDIYRRALEKPDKKKNRDRAQYFYANAERIGIENGIPADACKKVTKAIIDNSAYLFNKSHSIAYSYISFDTAWVKINYPLVFFTCLFNAERISNLSICFKEATSKKFNIKINPPHVSKSQFIAIIENIETNEVRMGLNCVKGLGETSVKEIIKAQSESPFKSIQDFYIRVDSKGRNKKNVEACISIGAFEGIPLEIHKEGLDDVTIQVLESIEEYHNNTFDQHDVFAKTQDDMNYYIYLDRFRQKLWFDKYIEYIDRKPEKNYAIDINYLPGQMKDMFNQKFEKEDAFDEMIRKIESKKYVPTTPKEIENEKLANHFEFLLSRVKNYKKRLGKKHRQLKRVQEIYKDYFSKAKEYRQFCKEAKNKYDKSLEHYIVVKESQLELFNIAPDDEFLIPVRLKPIGVLAEEKVEKKDVFSWPFLSNFESIAHEHQSLTKAYLDDIDKFEISFIPHPATKYNTDGEKPFNEVSDGAMVSYIGIVHDVIQKLTRTGKPMYQIMFLTKYDLIRISVWSDGPKKYPELFDKGNLVMVTGKKGYGGISASGLSVSTPRK